MTIRVAQHLILALPLEVISVLVRGIRVSECVCHLGCQGSREVGFHAPAWKAVKATEKPPYASAAVGFTTVRLLDPDGSSFPSCAMLCVYACRPGCATIR